MLKKGVKLFGAKPGSAPPVSPGGPKLDDEAGVQKAIAGFDKIAVNPGEKMALALKIIRAAKRFNIVVSPGSLIGRLAGMKA